MNDEHPIRIDICKMFPEAARRVQILKELKRSWKDIAKRAARDSEPYCLGVNELCVAVKNPNAEKILNNMKGSILRAMTKRWGYESDGEFILTITPNLPKPKPPAKKPVKMPPIEVDEEKVRQYMQGAPDTLPEDINYALSHLRAFLEQRFPENLTPQSRT